MGPGRRLERLSVDERLRHCLGDWDNHWYRLAASFASPGDSFLDVGSGGCEGLRILRGLGFDARGIDPLPLSAEVDDQPIEFVPDASRDVVVAIDVVEHVDDDLAFVRHLVRVARRFVLVSTPNWRFWRCRNEFHLREYVPEELEALLAAAAPGLRVLPFSSSQDYVARRVARFSDALENFGALMWIRPPSADDWRDRIRAECGASGEEGLLLAVLAWVRAHVLDGLTSPGIDFDPAETLARGVDSSDRLASALAFALSAVGVPARIVRLHHSDGASRHMVVQARPPDGPLLDPQRAMPFRRRRDRGLASRRDLIDDPPSARTADRDWRGADGRGYEGFFMGGAR